MAVLGRFKGTVVQIGIGRGAVEIVLTDGEREVTFPLLDEREHPKIGDELIVEVRNA